MSTAEILASFPNINDNDTAAKLLALLCPDFVKNNIDLEPRLSSPESFGTLLFKNRSLMNHVKDAATHYNFDRVWEMCVDDMEPNTLHQASFEYRLRTLEKKFTENLPPIHSLGFQTILAKNHEIANRRFTAVLLAHLLIFRQFLRVAHESRCELSEEHKYRWLLCQWWYPILDPKTTPWPNFDPFGRLFSTIEFESTTYIDDMISEVTRDIVSLLPETIKASGLFFVIDEANVGINKLPLAFHDETGLYPSLKEVINIWKDRLTSLGIPITFVVAGTNVPKQYFPQSSPEWSSWKWSSNTGEFDTMENQKRYVLPHRFTSLFVGLLLQDGFAHPHGVVNRYVENFTRYIPQDATEYTEEEGPCNIRLYFNGIGELVTKSPLIQSTAHEVIFHYLITGEHPPLYGFERVDLVSAGVGQFVDAEMQSIAVDMPTVLVAAAMELSRLDTTASETDGKEVPLIHSYEVFSSYLRTRWENGETYSPATYIALYLGHAFQNGAHLKDIFILPKDTKWARKTRSQLERIVVFFKDETGTLRNAELAPLSLLPDSPPLGYRAQTAEDVVAWLNHEHPAAFCICPPDCGADLIFTLKRGKNYILVLLRTAGLGKDDRSSTTDLKPEFDKLLPSDIFTEPVDNVAKDIFMEAINALPSPLPTGTEFPVMRVVASFSSLPSLPSSDATRKISPIALLNTTRFQKVTEAFEGSQTVEGLIASLHDKRKRYVTEDFVPLDLPAAPTTKRQRVTRELQRHVDAEKNNHAITH
ncbi:hypothetical protein H0H81_000528 [Sphagnurus paluster]|uniref:Uncharacterized protein n=1 Tax=Sphagnurus paluster TaxID=117069 RepID=A0A9P7GMK1_9AGAR|nr:hypothetical protein H0H81_000528 [Sphagnurus paluster]